MHPPLVDIHTITLKDCQAECLDIDSKHVTAMWEEASLVSAARAAAPELVALGVRLCFTTCSRPTRSASALSCPSRCRELAVTVLCCVQVSRRLW